MPPLALPARGGDDPAAGETDAGAVQLFVERAEAVQPDFVLTPENAPAVAAKFDWLPT